MTRTPDGPSVDERALARAREHYEIPAGFHVSDDELRRTPGYQSAAVLEALRDLDRLITAPGRGLVVRLTQLLHRRPCASSVPLPNVPAVVHCDLVRVAAGRTIPRRPRQVLVIGDGTRRAARGSRR